MVPTLPFYCCYSEYHYEYHIVILIVIVIVILVLAHLVMSMNGHVDQQRCSSMLISRVGFVDWASVQIC